MSGLVTIPARSGKAAAVARGQRVKVVNTHGEQVVDTWAFAQQDLREFMSMEHTRATLTKMRPQVGDALYSNRRRPILTLVEDTSPGVHDTLIAACDDYRYGLLGCTEYHDNCTDNLAAALHRLGLTPPETPSPLNLFMNIPWEADGGLAFAEPVSKAGDHVLFEANLDVIVAFFCLPSGHPPDQRRDARADGSPSRLSTDLPRSRTASQAGSRA